MADDNVIVLPVIRVERYEPEPVPDGIGDHETIGSLLARKRWAEGPPPPRSKRRGANAMRRALGKIVLDAGTVEGCLLWLRQVMEKDHDPRALASLIEHWGDDSLGSDFDPARSWDECQRLMAFLAAFMAEYQKRFPMPRPKMVK